MSRKSTLNFIVIIDLLLLLWLLSVAAVTVDEDVTSAFNLNIEDEDDVVSTLNLTTTTATSTSSSSNRSQSDGADVCGKSILGKVTRADHLQESNQRFVESEILIPDVEYYDETHIISLDLSDCAGFINNFISEINDITRFRIPDVRSTYGPNQITKIHIVSDDCIIRYFMKNDDVYMVAVSISVDKGQTFYMPKEMPGPWSTQQSLVIHGSEHMGFSFEYSKQWDCINALTYSKIKVAFNNVLELLGNTPYPKDEESKKLENRLRWSIEVFVIMVAESSRNVWIAEIFNHVLNFGGSIDNMQFLYEEHFLKWSDYSDLSRWRTVGSDLSEDGRRRWDEHDLTLLNEADLESPIACEKLISMKWLLPTDFDEDGALRFRYHDDDLTDDEADETDEDDDLVSPGTIDISLLPPLEQSDDEADDDGSDNTDDAKSTDSDSDNVGFWRIPKKFPLTVPVGQTTAQAVALQLLYFCFFSA